MPQTELISFAARHWHSGRSMGMPPPTLASNMKFTPIFLASAVSSSPFSATSSLLEVTTLLPADRQRLTYS